MEGGAAARPRGCARAPVGRTTGPGRRAGAVNPRFRLTKLEASHGSGEAQRWVRDVVLDVPAKVTFAWSTANPDVASAEWIVATRPDAPSVPAGAGGVIARGAIRPPEGVAARMHAASSSRKPDLPDRFVVDFGPLHSSSNQAQRDYWVHLVPKDRSGNALSPASNSVHLMIDTTPSAVVAFEEAGESGSDLAHVRLGVRLTHVTCLEETSDGPILGGHDEVYVVTFVGDLSAPVPKARAKRSSVRALTFRGVEPVSMTLWGLDDEAVPVAIDDPPVMLAALMENDQENVDPIRDLVQERVSAKLVKYVSAGVNRAAMIVALGLDMTNAIQAAAGEQLLQGDGDEMVGPPQELRFTRARSGRRGRGSSSGRSWSSRGAAGATPCTSR